ncbi:MAG: hypothetical protein CMK89_08210 [Pseudomonadales bacterium]|nr:hypothetical protein [Pseudomonadales bacterium]
MNIDFDSLKRIYSKVQNIALWSIIGRIGTSVSSFASNAILLHELQPSDIATYFLLLSTISIASIVCLCGFNKLNVIQGAQLKEEDLIVYLANSLSIFVVLSAAFSTIWILVINEAQLSEATPNTLPKTLTIFLVICIALQIYFGELFRGIGKLRSAILVTNSGAMGSGGYGLIGGPVFLLITLILSYINILNMQSVSIAILISSFASLLYAMGMLRKLMAKVSQSLTVIDRVSIYKTFRRALPHLATTLIIIIPLQTELWVIALMGNESEVALYGAATRLAYFQNIPMLVIWPVIQRKVLKIWENSRLELLHLIKNLTITISVFNTIFVVTFILFGNEILTIFFGDRYGSGGVYLTLKSIQFSALSIEGLLTLIISLLEKSRTIVLVGVFALLAQTSLSFMLFDYLNSPGILLALILTSTVSTAFYYAKIISILKS